MAIWRGKISRVCTSVYYSKQCENCRVRRTHGPTITHSWRGWKPTLRVASQDTLEFRNSLPKRPSASFSFHPPLVAFVWQENDQAPMSSRPLNVSRSSNGYRDGLKFVHQQQNPITHPRSNISVSHLDPIGDSMLKLSLTLDLLTSMVSILKPLTLIRLITSSIYFSSETGLVSRSREPTSSAASISTFPPQSGPQRTAAQKPSGLGAPYIRCDAEKMFECVECGQRMKRKGDMKRHMKKHGGFSFFCKQPGCTSKFKLEDSFKRHMRTQHNSL